MPTSRRQLLVSFASLATPLLPQKSARALSLEKPLLYPAPPLPEVTLARSNAAARFSSRVANLRQLVQYRQAADPHHLWATPGTITKRGYADCCDFAVDLFFDAQKYAPDSVSLGVCRVKDSGIQHMVCLLETESGLYCGDAAMLGSVHPMHARSDLTPISLRWDKKTLVNVQGQVYNAVSTLKPWKRFAEANPSLFV